MLAPLQTVWWRISKDAFHGWGVLTADTTFHERWAGGEDTISRHLQTSDGDPDCGQVLLSIPFISHLDPDVINTMTIWNPE